MPARKPPAAPEIFPKANPGTGVHLKPLQWLHVSFTTHVCPSLQAALFPENRTIFTAPRSLGYMAPPLPSLNCNLRPNSTTPRNSIAPQWRSSLFWAEHSGLLEHGHFLYPPDLLSKGLALWVLWKMFYCTFGRRVTEGWRVLLSQFPRN